jgi:hypothetical protein
MQRPGSKSTGGDVDGERHDRAVEKDASCIHPVWVRLLAVFGCAIVRGAKTAFALGHKTNLAARASPS